ncbi:MAG: hypothetical protein WA688_07450 [Thermoplasmata archaeon]
MADGEVREVRYLRTPALTRVVGPLDGDAIASLSANRSGQFELKGDTPVPYLRLSDKGVRTLSVEYNRMLHGQLNKEELLAEVKRAFGEAVVQEMDLFMPGAFSKMLSERVEAPAEALADISKIRFVMHLVHYPCRRDGERNAFWADVRAFMTEDEKTWMEAASLDLSFFVPFEVFRDWSRKQGRVGSEWREAINQWKNTIGSRSDLVREGFVLLFPDSNMRNRRDYEWAPEKRWILRNVGHW